MDRGGGEPALGEVLGHLGGGALGPAEHQGEAAAARLEDARQHLDLVERVRPVDQLLDGLDGVGVLVRVAHGPDVGRLLHVAAGQRDDRARHRRGEQHRLAVRGRLRHQRLDVGQEPEVQHLVGLVEHDGAGLRQVEVALLGQVDEPAGGADDDLDALAQGVDLRLVGPAAVDGDDAGAAVDAGPLEVAGHLHRELAGRGDDEGLRLARLGQRLEPLVGGGDHALEDRDAEAERLAGTGLGLADDVVAAEGHRQGHRLDGERVDDVGGGERGHDVRVDVEVGERRQRRLGDGQVELRVGLDVESVGCRVGVDLDGGGLGGVGRAGLY